MKTVSFDEYKEGIQALIDLDTCSPRVASDYHTRNENLKEGKPLCSKCDGTGNQLMYMYSRCDKCNGSGIT